MKFIIIAAAPKGVPPLPVESQAKNPDKPEIIMPKTGMKIATIEKTSEAIPKASIIDCLVGKYDEIRKKAATKHYMVVLQSNKTR